MTSSICGVCLKTVALNRFGEFHKHGYRTKVIYGRRRYTRACRGSWRDAKEVFASMAVLRWLAAP